MNSLKEIKDSAIMEADKLFSVRITATYQDGERVGFQVATSPGEKSLRKFLDELIDTVMGFKEAEANNLPITKSHTH